jgi:hypothetical protein
MVLSETPKSATSGRLLLIRTEYKKMVINGIHKGTPMQAIMYWTRAQEAYKHIYLSLFGRCGTKAIFYLYTMPK